MQPAQIFEKLQAEGVAGLLEFAEGPIDPSILVEPDKLQEVLSVLKEHDDLRFDQLSLLSGVPYEDRFECVYHLLSTVLKHAIVLRVKLDAQEPSVPTASTVHPTADWHERETFDLVGIRFEGHPDLRRIYLPEGWVGHPMRRDYVDPEEFQGIPLTDVKREEWEAEEKAAKAAAAEGAASEEAAGSGSDGKAEG